ncbi:exonuclease domain-containing protein [Aestuariivita sp.]|jgi:DNA polymerase-3 subunit epsilon|uniref:3'-5' exonuclease n=1 Tax=Aestuariivita sp. TaxID=1872407 RepID=UPI00216CDE88|nr:exonuclease domain-containing protein [Aestuariivita sp.]MCE8009480.1 3'-5' exonuclease [Aestuariivita sp.]
MFTGLSLRLRVFLFFCLLALGGLAITIGGLIAGYMRAAQPELFDAYVFSGLIIGFLVLGLVTGVWLLFDENVAKPIERLASELRVRAHTGVASEIDIQAARYLGDLAPAANAIAGQLAQTAEATASNVASQTARLAAEKDRLTAILSDIPVAMIVVNPAHQIVLYDAQSAAVLAQVAHPRLNASLFDYFDRAALEAAYGKLVKSGREVRWVLTGADGAQSYETVLKPLGDAPGYMLVIEEAQAQIDPHAPRPLIYDFDLLNAETTPEIAARPLKEVCFVVFDSETTGLLPHKDAVVQIGAVRVLNGRIIEGEVFDTLVDPGRPIPPASTQVHKVTDAMVAGAPEIPEAGRSFHSFCRDAVIVAHNAPFDMAFLHRDARAMGVTWDHPILDTVLVSAVLFGASETHTLDALAARLGVTIPEALRHTALGDARATAEVLCHMLPMLEARGLLTFGDVIAETRKHGRLLEDLN